MDPNIIIMASIVKNDHYNRGFLETLPLHNVFNFEMIKFKRVGYHDSIQTYFGS